MSQETLPLRVESQLNPVADEVSATIAVIRPILEATLFAVKGDLIDQAGGHDKVTLEMLARLYRPGDGDCGICFEWAVHDAMNNKNPMVLDRVTQAMKQCRNVGQKPASILFSAEKGGAAKLIDTASSVLTSESRILTGSQAQPPKLKTYLNHLAAALRRPEVRTALPYSISGLWKADLFLGHTDTDRWVGTTVKVNPTQLEGARGLRIGIVPTKAGKSDKIVMDPHKNLVICPIPHDGSFMEVFYQGWFIVQQFIHADAHVPKEVALPRPTDRQVAKELEQRRKFPVLDVVEALRVLAQPELLKTKAVDVPLINAAEEGPVVGAVIAPSPSFA